MSIWLPRPATWANRSHLSPWWLASIPMLQGAVIVLPELNNTTAGLLASAITLNSVYRCLMGTSGDAGVDLGAYLLAFHIWMSTMDLLVFRRREIVSASAAVVGKDSPPLNAAEHAPLVRHTAPQPSPPRLFSLARLKWAFYKLGDTMYRCAFRLDGHDKPVAESERQSRTRIVVDLIRRVLVGFVWLDVAISYLVAQPFARPSGPAFSMLPLPQQALISLANGFMFYGIIAVRITSIVIPLVIARIYNPLRSPTLFGHWGQNTTVKAFWGKGWHQMFRTCFKSPSHWFMKRMGIDEFSALGEAIKIPVAFLLSALLHSGGQYCATGTGIRTFTFFMLQPLAIGVEKLAARYTPAHLKEKYARPVGLVWTYGFLLLTQPLMFTDLRDTGIFLSEPAGFSVVRAVLYGEWTHEAKM